MLNILTLLFFTVLAFGQEFTESQKQFIKAENILKNPGGENGRTDWVLTAGALVSESTIVVSGKKSLKITLASQAFDLRQDSTLYQAQFADGVQGLASVRVKTTVSGLRVCSRQNGVVSSNLCVNVQANGKWGLYKVPFTLGGTSNGIEIDSNSVAVTGDVYFDDAFVGAVDLAASVDQSRIAGESYFAGTTSCQWQRTSATVGAFGTTAACPGPTIVRSSMGQWQTTDSDLPRQTINNLPAGVYKATFTVAQYLGATSRSFLAINDGTTTCEAQEAEQSTVLNSTTVSCTFQYTSSGNRVFELYGAASSGTIYLANDITSPRASTKFILEYYGSGTTYSSTNADTDWQSCQFASLAWQGFGTVSGVETQCKRQGSDLLMRGKFVSGTVAALEARLNLPTWNGVQLTSKGTQSIPTIQTAGSYIRNNVSTEKGGMLFTEPSVSYLTFGPVTTFGTSSTNATSKANGSDITIAGSTIVINARIPIEGWENSNIIIGQFNGLESCTNTLECTDYFSAKVSAAGVVSDENVSSFINGNCTFGTPVASQYNCTVPAGIFTTVPNCTGSANSSRFVVFNQASSTTTNIVMGVMNVASAFVSDTAFSFTCQKQGVDYIGKTAKAVASDQNISTPGTIKSTLCSAKISSTGVITDQKGGCFASCTNATTPVCTFTSNYWVSGQAPNCWHSVDTGDFVSDIDLTSTTFAGVVRNSAGVAQTANRVYFCHGERQ